MTKIVLGAQMDQVFDAIALGLVGKEIGAENVIEGQVIEASFAIPKTEMDGGFDHGVPVRHPVGRAQVNIIVIYLAHGESDVVAKAAKVFIYRIRIGFDLDVARWAINRIGDGRRRFGCGRSWAHLSVLTEGAQRQET